MHKSIFAGERLNYLDFEVSADGYSATDGKIKAMVKYPLPKTFRSLSRFCGAVNFYHKTIEKCSELLRPLYEILNSNQKRPKSTVIQWSDQQKFYFEKVKAALGKKTVLSYPIPYAETFCLQTQVIFVLLPLFTNLIPVQSCVCPLPFFPKS